MDQGNGLVSSSAFWIIIIALNLPFRMGSVTGDQFCKVSKVVGLRQSSPLEPVSDSPAASPAPGPLFISSIFFLSRLFLSFAYFFSFWQTYSYFCHTFSLLVTVSTFATLSHTFSVYCILSQTLTVLYEFRWVCFSTHFRCFQYFSFTKITAPHSGLKPILFMSRF